MNERDADKKAERPERAGRVGGRTAESTGAARQAFVAPGEKAGDEALGLMEEVLRRENLMAAYRMPNQMGLVSLPHEHQKLARSP